MGKDKQGKYIFEHIFNAGFVCIIDLFDINDDFRSFESLIELGIELTLLNIMV